jgi:putative Mg2+ transporter-C (MgtC) family protein
MPSLEFSDILLRLGAAFLSSFIIGWERQSHGRPAGLRTTILACVAAAVAMIISEFIFVEAGSMPGVNSWRPDPARLGAGILTGIGFLGGGAILKHADFVLGVTTAATLWFATVIGLAFGAGLFAVGWLGFAVALIVLFVLPSLERHIPTDAYATLKITARPGAVTLEELHTKLAGLGLRVSSLKLGFDKEMGFTTFITSLKFTRQQLMVNAQEVMNLFGAVPGVLKVEWD